MLNVFTTTGLYGTTVYAVAQYRPDCFAAYYLTFLPNTPFTADELAERARDEAEFAAYDAYCAEHGYDEEASFDAYTTEEAARRATELRDRMNFACEEIDAMGAGGMGLASMATRRDEKELEALQEQFGAQVRMPNPYTERGVEDWSAPVSAMFPPGARPTDDDVLRAMGERTAR